MAREVSGDVATLLHAVDLRVVMGEEYVVFLLPLLHIDICVVWTSDKDSRGALIEWVVGELEIAESAIDLALATDVGLSDELFAVPVP